MHTLLRAAALWPLSFTTAFAATPSDSGFPPSITLSLLAVFAALFAVLMAARSKRK